MLSVNRIVMPHPASVVGAGVLLFLVLSFYPNWSLGAQQGKSRITGTYTNMHFSAEGGDLLGQELKIVLTRKGYQGALQFAEGGAGELIIVDVHLEGNNISFAVPEPYSEAGQFTGTVQNGVIDGLFRFKGGGEEKVVLQKGKSYWD